MPFIKCPACGLQVSAGAAECPMCGSSIRSVPAGSSVAKQPAGEQSSASQPGPPSRPPMPTKAANAASATSSRSVPPPLTAQAMPRVSKYGTVLPPRQQQQTAGIPPHLNDDFNRPTMEPGSQLLGWQMGLVAIGFLFVVVGVIVMAIGDNRETTELKYENTRRGQVVRTIVHSDQALMETGAMIAAIGFLPWLAAHVIFFFWLHSCWSAIPRQFQSITPGTAVGYLFIPFLNIVWMFYAIPGLSTALTKSLIEQNPDEDASAAYEVGLTACILSLIPLLWLISPILFIIWQIRANSATNRLLASD